MMAEAKLGLFLEIYLKVQIFSNAEIRVQKFATCRTLLSVVVDLERETVWVFLISTGLVAVLHCHVSPSIEMIWRVESVEILFRQPRSFKRMLNDCCLFTCSIWR